MSSIIVLNFLLWRFRKAPRIELSYETLIFNFKYNKYFTCSYGFFLRNFTFVCLCYIKKYQYYKIEISKMHA